MNLLSLILIGFFSATTKSYNICNSDLLYSYGVTAPKYTNHTSLMCGNSEPESCCSHNDETNLSKIWKETNRYSIKPYLDGYIHLMKRIFNFYEDIIVLAKYVKVNTESSIECKKSADYLIINYLYRENVIDFVERMERIFENITSMRRSFYCSLCSVANQKYFDTQTKKVRFSNKFCENLVGFSIEIVHERVTKILETFEHINRVINCKEGITKGENTDLQFSASKREIVEKCKDSYENNKDPLLYLEECYDFCASFSFSTASEVFEGKLSRLEFIHDKVINSGLESTDPYFIDVSEENYAFYKLTGEFFENKLSFEDLSKYESIFDVYGIEPFSESTHSLYYYGLGKDSLKQLKESNGTKIVSLMVVTITTWLWR